jgi:hypothetical protein
MEAPVWFASSIEKLRQAISNYFKGGACPDLVAACAARRPIGEGVVGGNVPQRFSLSCLGFSFLFRGVQRGIFSFQRERSELMKADELPISAKKLSWQKPISARRSRLNEWIGDKAPN